MKSLIIIFIIAVLLSGCKSSIGSEEQRSISKLRQYIVSAISGDTTANRILSGLIDSDLPAKTEYNTLVIDSMKISGTKKFYNVLIQFDNPLFNRLAVYDADYNLLMLDQSLNGNISVSYSKESGPYLKVVEGFISKDMINLKRLSLYKMDTTAVYLAFRTFLSMSKPDIFISQDIEQFTDEIIITNLTFPEHMINASKKDTFVFYPLENKFKSKHRTFDSLVIGQVNSYSAPTFLPELIDKKTIRNNY